MVKLFENQFTMSFEVLLSRYVKYIFVLILQPFLWGQSFHHIAISESYKVKEVRIADEVLDEKDENTSYLIYSYENSMDKVLVYFKSTPDPDIEFECTAFDLIQKSNDALSLKIKSSQGIDYLNVMFFDKDQSISIGDGRFFLNKAYYSFAKRKILKEKNISTLVDFMDDFLQEYIYDLEKLRYISSREKYVNKDFKILKATMKTINGQAEDITTNWKIHYTYKNGVPASVEQATNDETRYRKTLMNHNKGLFTYKVYWQVDERYSDDKEVTFDIANKQYVEKGTYFQVGLNKEKDYETRIGKTLKSSSSKLELDRKDLSGILRQLNE